MFGHQDDQQDQQHQDIQNHQEPHDDGVLGGDDHQTDNVPTVVEEVNNEVPEPHTDEPVNPALPMDSSAFAPSAPTAPSDDLLSLPTPGANDLLDIKQQALQQLTPLVDHLDQSPEEKFRTTMMMIQASDDQALVKVAYEAAKQITDEKAKAQALLDIVNEINYFTHQSGGEA